MADRQSGRSPKVFISYKWQDTARNGWVERFYTDLRTRHEVDAQLDTYEVDFGESFSDYMTNRIDRECDCMLFVITPAAVQAVDQSQTGGVHFEMQLANARRMREKTFRIIGIYREGDANTAYLRDHRYVDFREDGQYEQNLKTLADSLWRRRRPPELRGQAVPSTPPPPIGAEVLVPAGAFLMGNDKRVVEVPEFYIDIYPFTNKQYREFVIDTGRQPPVHWNGTEIPTGLEDHPVVNISYEDAEVCAVWRSKKERKLYRLPTEEEWEKAARGPKGKEYPWGDGFDASRCSTYESGREGTSSVMAYPGGRSYYGCYDMAGNVWEWTSSLFEKESAWYVIRGGSWNSHHRHARCAYRYKRTPVDRYDFVGVRFSRNP